jgi:hypothetical protein
VVFIGKKATLGKKIFTPVCKHQLPDADDTRWKQKLVGDMKSKNTSERLKYLLICSITDITKISQKYFKFSFTHMYLLTSAITRIASRHNGPNEPKIMHHHKHDYTHCDVHCSALWCCRHNNCAAICDI